MKKIDWVSELIKLKSTIIKAIIKQIVLSEIS